MKVTELDSWQKPSQSLNACFIGKHENTEANLLIKVVSQGLPTSGLVMEWRVPHILKIF